MLSPDTKNRFLQLRAQGCTLSSIATQLRVSPRTLVDWNRLHKIEIRALRAIALEEVMSKCLPSREQTVTALPRNPAASIHGWPPRISERCGLLGPQLLALPRLSRISRFELPSYDSGMFALSPTGSLSPFLRQTCLFLFFCESQKMRHQHVTTLDFLRGAILSFHPSSFILVIAPSPPIQTNSNQFKPDHTLFQNP